MAHITRQTLGFYRESNEPEPIDVPALIESVLRLYSNKLDSKSIRVVRDFGDCPPMVGVAGELKQVVSNLVSNAIDAVASQGTIRISIKAVAIRAAARVSNWSSKMTARASRPKISTVSSNRSSQPRRTSERALACG